MTPVETPAAREARANRVHRGMQIERAALRSAMRELATPQPDPSIAAMRAAWRLAVGQQRVAQNEAAA